MTCREGTKSGLPFRRKILYYGLMLGLTLLALEGMARIAYYAAYGQGYGGGAAGPANVTLPPSPDLARDLTGGHQLLHPFYGFTRTSPDRVPNAMPPQRRREDLVVIGLLGGSVAKDVRPFLLEALQRWFAANGLPRRPAVLGLALGAASQPHHTMVVTNTLLLGGEFDLIINLDGFNEITLSAKNFGDGVFPSFPSAWHRRVGLTGAEISLVGHIGVLRREQARLAAARASSPLRWSGLFGLVNRWRQERAAAAIIQRNRQLAAMAAAAYGLEKYGPGTSRSGEKLFPEAARFWYRNSAMLARLAELAGADYYHFLQPNQHIPDSKPLSREELAGAYAPEEIFGSAARQGYPLLRAFDRDLQGQGINFFDLTEIFVDHPETLYIDDCCHLNSRGNELLAAAMLRRLEPALLRLGQASPDRAISALAAARRPAEANSVGALDFQVSLAEDGGQLRYVREDCAPADTEPLFFLRLIPQDLTDLPPRYWERGFEQRNFSFARVGGSFRQGGCAAQIPLPDYPIATLRTGQFVPDWGELWSVELAMEPLADPWRADYAALAAAEPTARDYFDLYALDSRLLYFRETCAAADMTAGFFLHIVPEDPADLPAARRPAGFALAGFDFARQGGHFAGQCLAAVALPDYPIAEMRTGQHIPGQGDLWSVRLIAAPDYAQLRSDYAALSGVQPVGRDYFDLYLREERLIYLRENCAVADTAAGFFLHIVPEDPADLPAERREAGFAYGGFAFVRQGGHFDGKCLAAVTLPDYPIKEMRTGQYVPGQGDLWSVAIAAP